MSLNKSNLQNNQMPAELLINLPILSAAEVSIANLLVSLDQGHVFKDWDPPSTLSSSSSPANVDGDGNINTDDLKHKFFDQISKLDQGYPGGLQAYFSNAKGLLLQAQQGSNPLQGWVPSVPVGSVIELKQPSPVAPVEIDGDEEEEEEEEEEERLHQFDNEEKRKGEGDTNNALFRSLSPANQPYLSTELLGLHPDTIGRVGFVLVAGGLGERLGFSGIKLALPVETLTGTPYLELYCQQILALQHGRNGLGLDGSGRGVALVGQGAQQGLGQAEVGELSQLKSFGCAERGGTIASCAGAAGSCLGERPA